MPIKTAPRTAVSSALKSMLIDLHSEEFDPTEDSVGALQETIVVLADASRTLAQKQELTEQQVRDLKTAAAGLDAYVGCL